MIFSHDTARSLQIVVNLVNSGPLCGGVESLPDTEALDTFVEHHRLSETSPDNADKAEDLAEIHVLRERLRAVFELDDAALVAHTVNALLRQSPICPRLTDHDDYDWHMHYFAPHATLTEHLAVDGGMALAHVVAAGETDRLRVCEAPDCRAALVDLSRNRSKRYCDARSCGNRLNVAAYRRRKRLELRTSAES